MRELQTLRRLLSIFGRVNVRPRHYLLPVILSLAAAAFEGVGLGLLIPLIQGFFSMDFSFTKEVPLLGNVVDLLPESVKAADRWLFVALILFFIFSMVVKNALKYSSLLAISSVGLRIAHRLRTLLFQRYLSFGKLYFDQSHVGHHTTVISEFAQQAISPLLNVGQYVNATFSLLAYFTILSVISWKLTLFALPLLILLHFAVRRLMERIRNLSRVSAENTSALQRKAVEILSLIPLVQSSTTEREEEQRYTAISARRRSLDFRKVVYQSLIHPMQEILTLLAILLLFSFMLYLMVREGSTTAPSFIVYFYLIVNAANKFGVLTSLRSALASAHAPIEEVLRVLDDTGKYIVPSGKVQFTGLKKDIVFQKLSFVFPGKREVLQHLSFRVEKGALTAIVGPTGAGKTTIINVLLRFYDCHPQAILIDGKDIREYDIASLRKHMALVSQETLLLHETLRRNITYGVPAVSEERMEQVLEQARLSAFISELPQGLETLIGDRGVKLSGGEKQRVSIARALLKGADILILDEATSSLDSRTERLIQEAIDEAIHGRTSIVIAHRLSTIQHADKIVVIDDGTVVEEGTLDVLLAEQRLFKEMWDEQKFS